MPDPAMVEKIVAGMQALGTDIRPSARPDVLRVAVGAAEADNPILRQQVELTHAKPENVEQALANGFKPKDLTDAVDRTNEQINTKRNPDTFAKETAGATDPLTEQRHRAERTAGLLNDYVNKGYDGLTESEDPTTGAPFRKEAKQQELRDMVLREVRGRPEFDAAIQADGEQAVAERMLRDPRYRAKLEAGLEDAVAKANRGLETTDIGSAEAALKFAEIERDARTALLEAQKSELTEVEDSLREYTEADGIHKQRMDELKPQQRQLQRDVAKIDRQLELYEKQMETNQRIVNDKKQPDALRQQAQAQIQDALNQYNQLSSNPEYVNNWNLIYEYQDLQTEFSELKGRKATLTREIATLEIQQREGMKTAVTSAEAVAEAQKKRTRVIETYLTELDSVTAETAKEFADSELADRLRILREAKPAAEAKLLSLRTAREQQLSDDLGILLYEGTEVDGRYRSRWAYEPVKSANRRLAYRILGRPEPPPEMVPHRRWTADDINRMLSDPDQVLQGMEFGGTEFANLPPEEQNMLRRNLIREGIDARKNLWNKPLTGYERRRLLRQPWMDSAIAEITPLHKELQEALKGSGVTDEELKNLHDPNVLAKIKRLMAGKGNLFLMALLVAGSAAQMTQAVTSSGQERRT